MDDLVSNRKARYQYEILETFEAGLSLVGTEVKSLRDNGGHLQEAYCKVIRGEVWLIGCHIAPYSHGNLHNHNERRDRKLLLHKREIEKLKVETQLKGLAIVPLGIYLRKGKIKLKIGLGKGKKAHDKRQAIKERETKRSMDRAIREHK